MSRARQSMKPQDILVLLKHISFSLSGSGKGKGAGKRPRQMEIAESLSLSQPEIVHCLSRLKHSGLLSESGELRPLAAVEFLVHGFKYVFPAELRGGVGRGHLTAAAAVATLQKKLLATDASDKRFVWAHADGRFRGVLVVPIYPTVPAAAMKDPMLHELLALLDAIRLGGVREQQMAREMLERRIKQIA